MTMPGRTVATWSGRCHHTPESDKCKKKLKVVNVKKTEGGQNRKN